MAPHSADCPAEACERARHEYERRMELRRGQQKLTNLDFDIGRAGDPTINYTMTPKRFMVEIPVAALANLSTDAHTRMLEMLNAWILRHKPPPLMVPPKDTANP